MDPEICLELIQIGCSTPSPLKYTPKVQINPNSTKPRFRFANKIKIPSFERPKSAVVSCLKTPVSRVLHEQIKRNKIIFDLKPWSKATSPSPSRPASSNIRKRLEVHSSSIFFSTQLANDTNSSLAEQPMQLQMSRYDDAVNSLRPNSAIQEYMSLNHKEKKVFTTEVPAFVHGNFPMRKIRKNAIKRSNTAEIGFDPPERGKIEKKRLYVKPCYYQLKRRYHPVKCKIDYVPRHNCSPIHNYRILQQKSLCYTAD